MPARRPEFVAFQLQSGRPPAEPDTAFLHGHGYAHGNTNPFGHPYPDAGTSAYTNTYGDDNPDSGRFRAYRATVESGGDPDQRD